MSFESRTTRTLNIFQVLNYNKKKVTNVFFLFLSVYSKLDSGVFFSLCLRQDLAGLDGKNRESSPDVLAGQKLAIVTNE